MTETQVHPGQDGASVMYPEPRLGIFQNWGMCQGWEGPLACKILGMGVLPPISPQEHALPAAPHPTRSRSQGPYLPHC